MDKFKSKEQQADQDLKSILAGTTTDYGTENGNGGGPKWGTLPGTKLRRPSTGSMTNLAITNGHVHGLGPNTRPLPYRHSVHIETYTEGEDEILESLVRSTTQQPLRTNERSRRKARYGDRKSCKSSWNWIDLLLIGRLSFLSSSATNPARQSRSVRRGEADAGCTNLLNPIIGPIHAPGRGAASL